MGLIFALIGYVGRALFGLLFLVKGISTLQKWNLEEQIWQTSVQDWLNLYLGQPFLQEVLEWAALRPFMLLACITAANLLGGLMLLLGIGVRLGSLLLLITIFVPTFFTHYIWIMYANLAEPRMIPLLENLALIGALLFFFAYPAGYRKMKPSQPVI